MTTGVLLAGHLLINADSSGNSSLPPDPILLTQQPTGGFPAPPAGALGPAGSPSVLPGGCGGTGRAEPFRYDSPDDAPPAARADRRRSRTAARPGLLGRGSAAAARTGGRRGGLHCPQLRGRGHRARAVAVAPASGRPGRPDRAAVPRLARGRARPQGR